MIKYIIIWTICNCSGMAMFDTECCNESFIIIEDIKRVKELYVNNLESDPKVYRFTDMKRVEFDIKVKEKKDNDLIGKE